jgi:hypothetical protein
MTETKESIIDQVSEPAANGSQANGKIQTTPPTPVSSVIIWFVLLVFTYVTLPTPFQPEGKPTLQHVWYYGWITAISTGFGVVPLLFMSNLDKYWIGISNGKRHCFFLSPCCDSSTNTIRFLYPQGLRLE